MPSSPAGVVTVSAEWAESQSVESQPVPTNAPNMMLDMRTYMSTSIQGFLIALAQTYSLRSFVLGLALGGATPAATAFATSNTKPDCSHSYALGVADAKAASDGDGDTLACVAAYNACVGALLDFRKAHTKLVSLYIITQALKGAKSGHQKGV
ncbi:hypothetical protein HK405_007406 [Cladochytrium tenue]|nr:hypothetical protein HK405_007406 [Cladochytrium tenue]